jgi:uncharacterized membrane protein YhfC
MPTIVYLVGPFALGILGVRLLHQRYGVFVIGMVTFLVAWMINQTIVSVAAQSFQLTERSLGYAVIASLAAGIVEETARYVAFRRLAAFRHNRTWSASLTYALGHHGMETIIVGLTLLLIALVVRYRPGAITDPATLENCRALTALGGGVRLYNALERISVGLLIHACFSGVVMLAVVRAQWRWLVVAMAWHFAHNLIGFSLPRLSPHWLVSKAWIMIVVFGYSYLAVRVYQAIHRSSGATPPPAPVKGAPPMILPMRSA